MKIFYVDGKFVSSDEAVISLNDMIVLRGYGMFDFLRTYNKRPFYLEEHIQRLENSGKLIGLELPETKERICEIVLETLERNPQNDESNVRIVVSGGISPDSVTPQGNGMLIVMVTPKLELPEWWYTDGAKIITNPVERYIPGAKSTNYMSAVIALQNSKQQGAIEAIYVDREERMLEGTTTNLFAFIGSKLVTPEKGILPGITRQVMLDILKDEFDIELRDVKKDEIDSFEEVFITASNKEVVPVVQIDDKIIGDGKVGPRMKRVLELFKAYTDSYGNDFCEKKIA